MQDLIFHIIASIYFGVNGYIAGRNKDEFNNYGLLLILLVGLPYSLVIWLVKLLKNMYKYIYSTIRVIYRIFFTTHFQTLTQKEYKHIKEYKHYDKTNRFLRKFALKKWEKHNKK